MTWLMGLISSFLNSIAKEIANALFDHAKKPDTVAPEVEPVLDTLEIDGENFADIDGLGLGTDISAFDGLLS